MPGRYTRQTRVKREAWPLDAREQELIARARNGDPAAFEEIVRGYQNIAFRVAYMIVNSVPEAEDATQEGFVRAYHALDRFRVGAPLRPWLLRIVSNAARNRRVATTRRPTLSLEAVDEWVSRDPDISVEHTALTRERDDALLTAINQLRHDDRLVIACRYFLDLSEAETAAVMHCRPGTVKSRLSRSLKRLRTELDAMGFSDNASYAQSVPAGNQDG